jgi:hypothetical protein
VLPGQPTSPSAVPPVPTASDTPSSDELNPPVVNKPVEQSTTFGTVKAATPPNWARPGTTLIELIAEELGAGV